MSPLCSVAPSYCFARTTDEFMEAVSDKRLHTRLLFSINLYSVCRAEAEEVDDDLMRVSQSDCTNHRICLQVTQKAFTFPRTDMESFSR